MTDEQTLRTSDPLTDPLVEHAWWHSDAVTAADEPSTPTTIAGLELYERLDRNEIRKGGMPQRWRDLIVAIEREARAASASPDEPSTCPDCGLTAQRIGEIHINAQRAAGWTEPIHAGPQSPERDAILAGTHEPAVDDFGNQYMARAASASVPPLDELTQRFGAEMHRYFGELFSPDEHAAAKGIFRNTVAAAYAAETPEQGR